MGLLGGIAAVVFLTLAKSTRQKRGVLWGYLAASPFAFLGGLAGWPFSVTFGPLLLGGIPLVIGCAVGFALGRRARRRLTQPDQGMCATVSWHAERVAVQVRMLYASESGSAVQAQRESVPRALPQ